VNQEVAVIHEDPFRGIVPFNANGKFAKGFQPFLDFIGYGMPLPGIQDRADDEVVRKGGDFAQVKDP